MPPEASFSLEDAARRLGQQIATRRNHVGMTQQRLADQVGISKQQLQNIESGWSDRAKRSPANPRLSTLLGLCRELGGRIDLAYPTGPVLVFDREG